MSNVVDMAGWAEKRRPPRVRTCLECDCQTFFLNADASVECSDCGEIQPFKHAAEPPGGAK